MCVCGRGGAPKYSPPLHFPLLIYCSVFFQLKHHDSSQSAVLTDLERVGSSAHTCLFMCVCVCACSHVDACVWAFHCLLAVRISRWGAGGGTGEAWRANIDSASDAHIYLLKGRVLWLMTGPFLIFLTRPSLHGWLLWIKRRWRWRRELRDQPAGLERKGEVVLPLHRPLQNLVLIKLWCALFWLGAYF